MGWIADGPKPGFRGGTKGEAFMQAPSGERWSDRAEDMSFSCAFNASRMIERVASRAATMGVIKGVGDGQSRTFGGNVMLPESSEHKSYTPSRTPQSSDHMGRMEAMSWAGRVETKDRWHMA